MNAQAPRDANGRLWFELTVDPVELARDERDAVALVRVAARRGDEGAAIADRAVEIIIMDRSQSMHRHGKLQAAQRAVLAAIDALPEATYFAVIAGDDHASVIYPADHAEAVPQRATEQAKQEAKHRVAQLRAFGGTAMSGWLRSANEMLRSMPDAVRHAVLYTDGINEGESGAALGAALSECRDQFICDVRGVGTDWEPTQLRRIAGALQGEPEAVIDPHALRDDFVRLMERAQRLLVPRVYLRLSLNNNFQVESVRQVTPTENDLTESLLPRDDGTLDVPLLAWGEDSRDYLVTLRVAAGTPTDDEIRAARLDVVTEDASDGSVSPCARRAAVAVRWLRHRGQPTVINSATEARDLIQVGAATRAGIAAYKQGDRETALEELKLAVGIARRLGALDHLSRLQRLVVVDEFRDIQLRPDITEDDLLIADVRSTWHHDAMRASGREKSAEAMPWAWPQPAELAITERTCPNGHVTRGSHVRYCEEYGCDYEFIDDHG